jgi:maleylacetate reductase
MVMPFTHLANPARVLFGPGRLAELSAELERLNISRALLLTTSGQAGLATRVTTLLGNRAGRMFDRAAMHTPRSITEEALSQVRALRCDGMVSLGGGSAIGLGKALALRTDLPLIAVPTTYAGSK